MGEFFRPHVKTQRLELQGLASITLGSADTYTITKSSSVATGMVRSMNIAQTMTADIGNDGQVEVLKAQLNSEVNSGGWAVALSGVVNFGTAGHPNGVAAAISGEMIPPNGSLTRGSLYAQEAVFGCQSGSSWASAGPVAFQKYENYGTKAHFSANAFLFHLIGETGAAGALLSENSHTLKARVGTSTRYMVLSRAEDRLSHTGVEVTGTPDYVAHLWGNIPTGAQTLTNVGAVNSRLTIDAGSVITSNSHLAASYNRVEIEGGSTELGMPWIEAVLGYVKNASGTVSDPSSLLAGVVGMLNLGASYVAGPNKYSAALVAASYSSGSAVLPKHYGLFIPDLGAKDFTHGIFIQAGSSVTALGTDGVTNLVEVPAAGTNPVADLAGGNGADDYVTFDNPVSLTIKVGTETMYLVAGKDPKSADS